MFEILGHLLSYLLICLETAGYVTNSVDSDQMLWFMAFLWVYTVCSVLSSGRVWVDMVAEHYQPRGANSFLLE